MSGTVSRSRALASPLFVRSWIYLAVRYLRIWSTCLTAVHPSVPRCSRRQQGEKCEGPEGCEGKCIDHICKCKEMKCKDYGEDCTKRGDVCCDNTCVPGNVYFDGANEKECGKCGVACAVLRLTFHDLELCAFTQDAVNVWNTSSAARCSQWTLHSTETSNCDVVLRIVPLQECPSGYSTTLQGYSTTLQGYSTSLRE